MNQFRLAGVLATLAIVLLSQWNSALANVEHPKNLPDLYEVARELESVHMQITEHRKSHVEKRHKALYAFAHEPKSAHCDEFYGKVIKVIDEYRIKAYNYIADTKKQTGWFGNIMKIMGPIGPMKGLSKIDPALQEVTERYESQAKSGFLSDADVDCDLLKFHIRILNKMMFVLQADIKYLATEQAQLLNEAIYRQLLRNRFVASTNFYEINELTPGQAKLLRDFYLARVDLSAVNVGEAVEHFSKPSNLVIGRLLDSCHTLIEFKNTWIELEPERANKCVQSKSDMKNELFTSEVKLSDYAGSIEFCEPFLNSV